MCFVKKKEEEKVNIIYYKDNVFKVKFQKNKRSKQANKWG